MWTLLRRLAAASLLLISVAPVAAQTRPTGVLAGQVTAATTGRPVPDAIVSIVGTGYLTATTAAGRFRFDSVPPGIYALRAAAIGFAPLVKSDVVVSSGRPAEVALVLVERPVELPEISVVEVPYFPPALEQSPGTRILESEEIRRAPGVQEDVLRAVALLPGVGVTTAARNDLAVRGGAPFENLFVVDGQSVPNLNHFGSQGSTGGPASLVNLVFVDEAAFTAGGFGARYGDRVGSTTDLTLREGNRERMTGTLNLSATGFGAIAEGPVGRGGAMLASVRRSYIDLLFKLAGFRFLPSYWDGQFKFTRRLSDRDQLSWLVVGALDRVDFNNETAADRVDNSRILRIDQNQYFSSLAWRHAGERGRLSVTLGRTFTRYDTFQNDSLDPPNPVFRNRSSEGESSLSLDVVRELGPVVGSLGATARYADQLRYRVDLPGALRLDQNGTPAPLSVDTAFTAFRAGGYAEAAVRMSPAARFTLGARLDHYDFLRGAWRASPRGELAAQIGRTALSLRGGRYWQTPSYIWLVGDPANARLLRPFRADQVVLGVQRLLRPDLRLQVETYYKRYAGYPARGYRPQAVLAPAGFEDVKSDIPFGLEPLVSVGTGRSYGVELLLQKKLSAVPLYGLASLSLGRSEFTGLDGVRRAGAFDARVIGNLLVGWRPSPAWEVSGKFRVASGLPSTPFITSGTSAGQLDFTRYNAGPRLPTFHALDVRADRRWSWRTLQLVTYVDVQNVYARANVSQFDWSERKQRVEPNESLGVLPTIGVSVEF